LGGDDISVDDGDVWAIWDNGYEGRGVGVVVCQWGEGGGVGSDIVVDGSRGEVGAGAEVTEPFLVSGEGTADVSRNPGANNIGSDGSLANIDLAILEDGSVNPVGEELGATKSFTPSNGEGAIVGSGKGEFEGSLGATSNEVGDIDLVGVVEGRVEDIDSLGDDGKSDKLWGPAGVVVGRNEDSCKGSTTAEWGLVDGDLWDGVGVIVSAQGDGVSVEEEDGIHAADDSNSGVGAGGEGLAV